MVPPLYGSIFFQQRERGSFSFLEMCFSCGRPFRRRPPCCQKFLFLSLPPTRTGRSLHFSPIKGHLGAPPSPSLSFKFPPCLGRSCLFFFLFDLRESLVPPPPPLLFSVFRFPPCSSVLFPFFIFNGQLPILQRCIARVSFLPRARADVSLPYSSQVAFPCGGKDDASPPQVMQENVPFPPDSLCRLLQEDVAFFLSRDRFLRLAFRKQKSSAQLSSFSSFLNGIV